MLIIGLEDGLLPLHWPGSGEATFAEERRLFYVGMTRAKDRLVLSPAQKRLWRGRIRTPEASPFLDDIENELLQDERARSRRRKPEDRQLKLF